MTPVNALLMFFSAFLGGLVQSVTGFGSGIVMMVFMPIFLTLTKGAAVSSLISLPLNLTLVWTYRKHIKLNYVYKPCIFYMLLCTVGVKIAAGNDLSILTTIFGIFLVVLAVYFFFFSDRVHVKASWLSAGVCGSISGIASGLFGIGGPPMVIYYMALTGGEKLAYLGNLQAFFALTGIYTAIVRIFNGLLTWDLIPFFFVGLIGSQVGKYIGTKIVEKLNTNVMKKIIYAFLAVSGILNIIG